MRLLMDRIRFLFLEAFMSELIVFDSTVNAAMKKAVKENVRECKCLNCKSEKATKRGLCVSCYNAWYYLFSHQGSKVAKAKFEAECIQRGVLLGSQDKVFKKAKNIFQSIAKAMK